MLKLRNKMLLEKLKQTIERFGLIKNGDRVLVGVSGGADSTALLCLLNDLRQELGISLHIAHLDHMLREESSKDKDFVRSLASRFKLPLILAQINLRKIAKKGSLEENARNARLDFLCRTARDIKADKIALGHNLDDQAETVLMRILRGSGLYGLSAILPKRSIGGFIIIRPLIEAKRKEIEVFLKKKKIIPRVDKTNFEEIYFRNRIRHKLLPLLERDYNRNIKQILSNMAESIGSDYDYLNRIASLKAKRLGSKIDVGKFLRLHPAVRRMVLRLDIMRIKGDMRRLTLQHIREIEDLVSSRPENSIVDLPKGISVVKRKKYLSFYRR